MQLHFSMDHLPEIPAPVVTVGSFDGVHAGHRTIINRLNCLAGHSGGASVLLTFDPHPRKVLYPDTDGKDLRLISSRDEKCLLLEDAGLDHLVIMPFTPGFARTPSDVFVKDYLLGRLRAHTIVVGFNHFFGHNREGNYDLLYRMSRERGFELEEIPEQEIQNETVSSTKIRRALREGNIQRANAYLLHHYIVLGELLGDSEKARLIHEDQNKLFPPEGLYALSLPRNGATSKLLGIISAEGLSLLHPEGGLPRKGSALLRFHKRLEGLPADPADRAAALKTIEELIY
ncbi:MAG: riboflavin biosynthesis protein RibF [Bacteroidetes bacterium]|nr:MAG: riboflavin biosynthesis protein RibF [Bacteroidota bacterium]